MRRMFGRTLPLDGFDAAPLVNVDIDHAHGFEHGGQAAFENSLLVLGVQMAGGIVAVFFGGACQRFLDRWGGRAESRRFRNQAFGHGHERAWWGFWQDRWLRRHDDSLLDWRRRRAAAA